MMKRKLYLFQIFILIFIFSSCTYTYSEAPFDDSELTPLVHSITQFRTCQNEINNLKELLEESDVAIREMAESELKEANLKLKLFEKSLLKLLIPKDHNDQKKRIDFTNSNFSWGSPGRGIFKLASILKMQMFP